METNNSSQQTNPNTNTLFIRTVSVSNKKQASQNPWAFYPKTDNEQPIIDPQKAITTLYIL